MRGILSQWREGTLDGLWMFPLALPFYDFITHMWWHGKQICGFSMACCSVVPVTVAEFDWMTLGGPASPVLLCFCWKLVPSDCLFISVLGCCVQSCSCPLAWEFPPGSFPPGTPSPDAEVSHVYLVSGSIRC